jgi:hypothetical protein
LLPKSQLLQLTQSVLLSSTIDDSIFEKVAFDAVKIDGAFHSPAIIVRLQLIRVSALDEAREVIALV